MEKLHVIFGTGPVGCWTARALREQGVPVRVVNRSGNRPGLMPDDVEIVTADAACPGQAIDAAKGATVIYQALNPPYHLWKKYFPALQDGVLAAAGTAGARYISIENLYMYDASSPINEGSPIHPRSKKGRLRAKMADDVMAAHQCGDIQAAALRSSCYYGPGVIGSAMGERFFANLVSGKKAQMMGALDVPHSWAYIEDVGRTAATLGMRDEALGKAWIAPHAPSCTQRKMVELTCQILGIKPRLTGASPLMLRMVGLFVPEAGASVEMMYQYTEPFVVDSEQVQNAFDLEPTPIETGLEKTIKWYKENSHTW